MSDLNEILNLAMLALLALGAMWIRAAVKTSAEEAAKAAVEKLRWPGELARELQKTRGVERQELRYQSYGLLWKELRPLAIYDATVIDKKAVGDLSSTLSDWYFSECGGILLTPQARGFYFALQDLLRTTSRASEEWSARGSGESEMDHKRTFEKVLEAQSPDTVSVLKYFSEDDFDSWQEKAIDLGERWRVGINVVAAAWNELDELQRFASLQQVGSKLRTSLVTDLESRLP